MSVIFIAKDLYRAIREVEKLEKELETAPQHKREILEDQLRKAKAEQNLIRRMLDGTKDVEKNIGSDKRR